jgi:hypothetical protein
MPTAELTREEIVGEMERVAQRRRRLSAAEVIRRYRAGSLEDAGELADVLILATLLPEDDPLFATAA